MTDSDPSSSSPAAVQLCTTYREELEAHSLDMLDACPVCTIPVGRHIRQPVAAPTAVSPPVPTSSHIGGDSTPRPMAETRIAEQLAKLASHLDKWSRQSVCRPFLQRIKQVLMVSRIPDQYWPDVFVHLVPDLTWPLPNGSRTTYWPRSSHGIKHVLLSPITSSYPITRWRCVVNIVHASKPRVRRYRRTPTASWIWCIS